MTFAVLLCTLTSTVSFAGKADAFTDVAKKRWYYKAVEYVCSEGLFSGTSATTFSPDGNMTRAMLATVLAKMSGDDISGYKTVPFEDVKRNSWYSKASVWADKKGIIKATTADWMKCRQRSLARNFRFWTE